MPVGYLAIGVSIPVKQMEVMLSCTRCKKSPLGDENKEIAFTNPSTDVWHVGQNAGKTPADKNSDYDVLRHSSSALTSRQDLQKGGLAHLEKLPCSGGRT